jgi:hypothetical protein
MCSSATLVAGRLFKTVNAQMRRMTMSNLVYPMVLNLPDTRHVLNISIEQHADGVEYVLVALDLGIVRISRHDDGVSVDLYDPIDDQLVGSIWETENDLFSYAYPKEQ